MAVDTPCPVRRVGAGPHHHFFGYYDKTPWDRTGSYLLAHRVPTMTAPLDSQSIADIGWFDLADGDHFHAVASTKAWNWQMGSQLQWLDGLPQRALIHNARTDDLSSFYPGLGASIYDLDTRQQRQLPLPIYVVSPNSRYALCVDYGRLQVTHPTIGYPDSSTARSFEPAPEDDGIHWMDIASGRHRLILSYRELREFSPCQSMDKAIHWISHIEIAPDSSRVLFLHRWTERVEDETCFLHRLITMNPDGSGLRLLECSDHPLPQLAETFEIGRAHV